MARLWSRAFSRRNSKVVQEGNIIISRGTSICECAMLIGWVVQITPLCIDPCCFWLHNFPCIVTFVTLLILFLSLSYFDASYYIISILCCQALLGLIHYLVLRLWYRPHYPRGRGVPRGATSRRVWLGSGWPCGSVQCWRACIQGWVTLILGFDVGIGLYISGLYNSLYYLLWD